jgi:cytochrome c oxidase subunit IV
MRECKYHMIILYRKQLLHACFYPFLFFYSTAAGAMPVSATVILIFSVAAVIVAALIHMIPKRCCTAVFYAFQNFCNMYIFIKR